MDPISQPPARPARSQAEFFESGLTPIDTQPEGSDCSICYEPLGSSVVQLTACNHIYHKDCITAWLNEHNTCPYCRRELYIKHLFAPPIYAPPIYAPPSQSTFLDNLMDTPRRTRQQRRLEEQDRLGGNRQDQDQRRRGVSDDGEDDDPSSDYDPNDPRV